MTVRDPVILDRIVAIKRELILAITCERIRRDLNQTKFSKLIGLHQGDTSHLLAGQRLERFSLDRLIMILIKLGRDITVQVR